MKERPAHETRLERILGVPLAEDAKRQWPQSGEVIDGRARIGEVESHFEGLRLGVGRRHRLGDTLVVEWSTDYGDGRVYRNVSVAELRDGEAVRVTDYWGEPFEPPACGGGGGRADPAARRNYLANRRRCAPLRCLRLRAAAPGRPPERRRGRDAALGLQGGPLGEAAAHQRLHELDGPRRSGGR